MTYLRLLQFVSGWVALCHLGLGVAGLIADAGLISDLIRLFYGATLEVGPVLFYVVKLIAAYFIAFGAAAALVTWRPVKYRALVPILILFFLIRLGELMYFGSTLRAEFQIPDYRLTEKLVSFSLIALLLAVGGYKMRPARDHSVHER